jgi:hypothetical protein
LAVVDAVVSQEVELLRTPRYPQFGIETDGDTLQFKTSGVLPLTLAYSIKQVGVA